jgi:hypothetical protein
VEAGAPRVRRCLPGAADQDTSSTDTRGARTVTLLRPTLDLVNDWPADDLGEELGASENSLGDLDRVRVHERPWVWVLLGLVASACGAALWDSVAGLVLGTLGAVITLAGTIALGVVLAARYLDR